MPPRTVVIVGGGLTGLSAARALEQQRIPYTLIEVQRQPGGSLQTVRQAGFVMDGAGLLSDASLRESPLLADAGLAEALTAAPGGVLFRHGTDTLVAALLARLTGPRLMRMAVSSTGELENGRFALCLENGLLLDARALILALPARYAARLFYGYRSAITEHLLPWQYETITRFSCGYTGPVTVPADSLPAEVAWLHHLPPGERTPPGGTLLQIALRAAPDEAAARLPEVLRALDLPPPAVTARHVWPEADLIFPPDHMARVAALHALLPPGMVLAGSDYAAPPPRPGVAHLAQRLADGVAAARQVQAFLAAR